MLLECASAGRVALEFHHVPGTFCHTLHHVGEVVYLCVAVADKQDSFCFPLRQAYLGEKEQKDEGK